MKTKIKIERISKCIWEVNGHRVDIRGWHGFSYGPIRKAFIMVFSARNPHLKWTFIDHLYCSWHNRPENMMRVQTLEWMVIL